MFQRMQELVKLNESLVRDFSRPRSHNDDGSALNCSSSIAGNNAETEGAGESAQMQIHRLQMIIVQQAAELRTLQRKQRDATADGRVWRSVASTGKHCEGGEKDPLVLLIDSDEEDTGFVKGEQVHEIQNRHANQLRKLPLTLLRAQLKGKDLQLQRLQQKIAKLESRFEKLIDRKRSMEQNLQRTARTQQAHLKKYLACIRQQTAEKTALERQLRQLKQYVDVLEKKVVSSSRHC
ncbi:hypothetical protein GN244_ATG10858 [Phytophthora infestans]|uniref:Uncharacterized protein n=1 Tax=Phytophthora infestans TaxID=4787 RepID=A0A833WC69_PHYIN|nr:hypothetical protein GN244_ATG10858 [Phytophthora infestans]KAF4146953.1 hypothetical protein GN958_ATG03840 [Phytophthora infestans]